MSLNSSDSCVTLRDGVFSLHGPIEIPKQSLPGMPQRPKSVDSLHSVFLYTISPGRVHEQFPNGLRKCDFISLNQRPRLRMDNALPHAAFFDRDDGRSA